MDENTRKRIRSIFEQQFDDPKRRRSILTPQLQSFDRFHSNINWDGSSATFTQNLIDQCEDFSELEDGKPAIVVVLRAVWQQVGVDIQAQIDELMTLIDRTPTLTDEQTYQDLKIFREDDAKYFF